MAVDWINNHIYWTDSIHSTVEVATLDGKKKSVVVFCKKVPRDIVVDPIDRYKERGKAVGRDRGKEGRRERELREKELREEEGGH